MFAALMNPRPKTGPRSFSLVEQAHALNVVLRKEFGIPFVFYQATTGEAVQDRVNSGDSWKPPTQETMTPALNPAEVMRLAADTQPEVTILADGRYQLTIVFYDAGKPLVVGAGLFVGLAKNRADTEREQKWLQQWLQSVSDRLRMTEQLQRSQRGAEDHHVQAKKAWEGLLAIDNVARRLRVHKDPARNRQRVLESAHALLGTQTLVWVPKDNNQLVQMAGDPCLSQLDCRSLAATLDKATDLQATGHILYNNVQSSAWGGSYPSLDGVMAFAIGEPEGAGWVLALNRLKPREAERKAEDQAPRSPSAADTFRRADAALLVPFVALLRMHASASSRYQELKDLMVGMARALTSAIDAKDSYTFGHSERVARIGVELGRSLSLEGDDLSDIYLSGLLHDVGKIGIRDEVLRKVDPLTQEEYEHIKQHVTIGYTILADLKPIRNLLPGVLYHHERWDGKGYPDGLKGEATPLLARILAVADAYDAMSTNRPYREALPCREVEERLRQGAGTQWDAKVIEAFGRCRQKIHAIRQRGVGESLRTALDAALRSDEESTSVTL